MADLLPALAALEALPSSPAEVEGWSPDDLERWITNLSGSIAQGERMLDAARLAVGLALWKLRTLEPDGSYGQRVVRMAELTGMSVRTLQGWRTDAQAHFSLPAPDARSAGQQKSADARRPAHPQAPDARRPAHPDPKPELVTPSEVIPPQPEQEPRGKKPAPGPPAFQQLALPLEEAGHAIETAPLDELVALPPELLDRLAARIAEAQRAQRRLTGRAAAPACDHPKPMLKTLPYATICDQAKGGCGTKVR